MLNQYRLSGNPMPSMQDRRYMSLRGEDPRPTAYSQSVSQFIARLDLSSTLSSNGSSYCESDLESLDHFDNPFTTQHMETYAGLVHPAPRSNIFAVASNSFLLGAEKTPCLSPFRVSDAPQNEQVFSNAHFSAPSPHSAKYSMSSSLNPHSNSAHLVPSSTTSPGARPVNYDEVMPWSVYQPASMTDMWYSTRDHRAPSEDSGWQTHNSYSAPWPVSNAYTSSTECDESAAHMYGSSNGMPATSFEPSPMTLGSSVPTGPMSHVSHLPVCESYAPSIEAPQFRPKPHPMYLPSTQLLSSDTEFGSPDQKLANSLSPSFSVSTNEEGQSPQQSGEEKGSIETSGHYSDERNTFLIDCKRRGLSYKDIKRVGGFKEAESTLRGRYRTLTKSKDQRVRKPKWQDKDIRLLCQAVIIHAESHDAYSSLTKASMNMNEPPKVSWKKVAEHIWAKGGSYHFGNATCKKKWCEINSITL
ncbi:hypothetical protein Pdw03_5285 [Penicillium digitatum]|nr:hypothetical protein Pdw03_5285 [Penicillium digitatum]